MRGPNHFIGNGNGGNRSTRYNSEEGDVGTATMQTNADVISIMHEPDDQMLGDHQNAPKDTSMVQDQDLQKLIGQFRDQNISGINTSTHMVGTTLQKADVSNCYNPVDISGTN